MTGVSTQPRPPAATGACSRSLRWSRWRAVVAIVLAGLGSGGAGKPAASRRAAAPTNTHRGGTHRAAAKPTASHSASTSASVEHHCRGDHASTAPASSTPGATGSPSAVSLQLLGYHLRLAGNYPAAIAADRRALAAANPSTLTYAFALYDLGVSLLRSGNPQAAIPYLEQRLKYNDQTATVQATLNQALQAAGGAPAGGGAPVAPGAAAPPGLAKGHDKHGKPGGD